MLLMTADKFQKHYFAETSRPTKGEIRDWVKSGAIVGTFIGKEVFIDQDSFEERFIKTREARAGAASSAVSERNPLLEKLRNP